MIREIGQAIDSLCGIISPKWELSRKSARQLSWTMDTLSNFSGNGPHGYDAGKKNRLTKGWMGANLNENAIPREQISQLRWNSWELYRNNPHARKICRTLEAKVIGRGLKPESQAQRLDGTAHTEFRESAETLWDDISDELDYRGLPGYGGQHIADVQKTALRAVILGGDCLYSFKRQRIDRWSDSGRTLPIQLQLIHPQRLADLTKMDPQGGNEIYQGIELFANGSRAAYWLYDRHPAEPSWGATTPSRYPASQVGHLYVSDDIDQLRGTPWFAAALLQMRDTSDYQYNELKASAIAACVVLGYRRASGQTSFGVNAPDNWDLTDADGNKISHIQPGMLLDLGQTGEIQGFNPSRPSTSAEAWINHMIRSTATSVAGVKGSTLTGDYRNSSFSSERSADNDSWPEIEGVQDWFAFNLMQPIYQQVIRTAFLTGYFDGIVTDSEFADNEKSFVSANWQGPVALSINPVDDATAAAERIANGTSSPQIESQKIGRKWRKILRDVDEFRETATAAGIPDSYIDKVLGGVEEPQATVDTGAAVGAAA